MRTTENVERIRRIDAYARNLYINEMDNDPCDAGLEQFVRGFIEGVLTYDEELT